MILPLHRNLDQARESALGGASLGTTRRGIGPAYEDKVGRRAIRLGDLREPDQIARKVENMLLHHNALLRGMGRKELNADDIANGLLKIAPQVLPFADVVWKHLVKKTIP